MAAGTFIFLPPSGGGGGSGPFDINSDTTGTLLVMRGGTGSSAALTGNKVMQSNAGGSAIIESAVDIGDVMTAISDIATLQTDVSDLQTEMSQAQLDIIDLQTDKVDKVAMTDNSLVRADGTGGDIQGSPAALDDGGNLSGIASLTLTGTASFLNLAPLTTLQRDALTPQEGMIIFNGEVSRFQGYFEAAWGNLHGWGT